MTDVSGTREKIAILGGGVGSMVAAWELTSVPGWKDRYEIDVYQMGWRLGGKGASGRNRKEHDRIEEHGLHVWMGFYENAFKVMREAYAELGRTPGTPLAGVWDAFKPHSFVVWEDKGSGSWEPWSIDFPKNSALPGAGGVMPSPWNYLEMMVGWVLELFEGQPVGARPAQLYARLGPLLHERRGERDAIVAAATHQGTLSTSANTPAAAWLARGLSDTRLPIDALGLHLAHELVISAGPDPTTHRAEDHEAIGALLRGFRTWLRNELGTSLPTLLRRFFTLVDLTIGNVLGFLGSGLLFSEQAWKNVDELDYRAWLTPYCLDAETPMCAPVQAFYDLVFCEDCGIAAGATLVCALRMLFTYKGAIFFKMQAGMGDTVFAPLYLALKARGVRFHFFHKIDDIVAEDGQISELRLTVQATMKQKGAEYDPLYPVKGLPCWPSRPLHEQLEQGDAIERGNYNLESAWTDWPGVEKKVLTRGVHFDRVVLGISIGSFPYLATSLLQQSPAMQAMVAGVTTTKTQAFQVWLNKDLTDLGWTLRSPVLTSYVEPFDTWADMSQLIPREGWDPNDGPANISYLCCYMPEGEPSPPPGPDPAYPAAQTELAKQAAIAWLKADDSALWPAVATPGTFDWSVLCAPTSAGGAMRFESQYWRANVDPSERYVRTIPGSTKVRLRSHQSGFENLVLAGDWVANALNGGCVESAAMAGMQASRAICGHPRVIIGDPTVDPLPPDPPDTGGLPPYVERGGNLVLRQPFGMERTMTYAFVLRSRYEALVGLVDQCLNAPIGERRYMPVAAFTTLMAANIGKLHSLNPIDALKGQTTELDIGFWVPVARGRDVDGVFVPEKLLWFLPYIFVDNSPAMATGREIYGFPKESGTLAIPIEGLEPGLLSADVIVIPTYSPDTVAEPRRVVEVSPVKGSVLTELKADFESPGDLAKALREGLVRHFFHETNSPPFSWKLLESLVSELFAGEVPMVFLQEFRDVEHVDGSAYQAIVEAPTNLQKLRGAGFLWAPHQVTVSSFDSHPIALDLGFDQGPLTPVLQTWIDFDFTMGTGTVVWSGGRKPSVTR